MTFRFLFGSILFITRPLNRPAREIRLAKFGDTGRVTKKISTSGWDEGKLFGALKVDGPD